MEVKPGYKQTEVGVIPEEWDLKPLSRLATEITVGIVVKPTQYYQKSGVPALRSANVRETGIDASELAFISERANMLLAKSQLRPGDVVTVRTGYPGTSAVVPPELAGANCIDILISRPREELHPPFLAAWINSPRGRDQVLRSQNGLAQQHFNVGELRELLVAVPVLHEQRAIAKALGDVDALLAGLDRLIAKKRHLKQAAMQELLTGKTRLPGFRGEWDTPALGQLFSFKNGLNKSRAFFGRGTPIVNYMDVYQRRGITSSELRGRVSLNRDELRAFDVRKGDVFFTRTSETVEEVGTPSVMLDHPSETVFSGFVLRARPRDDTLDDQFKRYCFSTPSVRSQITSQSTETTRALTNGRCLASVIIRRPPRDEQTAIAAVLSDMDAELEALEARREKTSALKQAMMQELLAGRIRLV